MRVIGRKRRKNQNNNRPATASRRYGKRRYEEKSDRGLGLGGSAFADGSFGKEGLLADAVGDFWEFALVGADGGEVVGLADEVEGAKSFPNLLVAGIDCGDFSAGGYG